VTPWDVIERHLDWLHDGIRHQSTDEVIATLDAFVRDFTTVINSCRQVAATLRDADIPDMAVHRDSDDGRARWCGIEDYLIWIEYMSRTQSTEEVAATFGALAEDFVRIVTVCQQMATALQNEDTPDPAVCRNNNNEGPLLDEQEGGCPN
jgi:hypothetical protein